MGVKNNTEILKAILGIENEDGTFSWSNEVSGDLLKSIFDLFNSENEDDSKQGESDLTVAKIIWDEYQEFIAVGFTNNQAFELVKAHCQSTWDAVAASVE